MAADAIAELKTKIQTETDRLIEDCTYSAKGQWNDAASAGRVHLWLGIPASLLAAASGGTALSSQTAVAAGLAFASGALAALSTFLNAEKKAATHKAAGDGFSRLKNEARYFRDIELTASQDAAALAARLKELCTRRDELNEASPVVSRASFERARRGIEEGEARYVADRERVRAAVPPDRAVGR